MKDKPTPCPECGSTDWEPIPSFYFASCKCKKCGYIYTDYESEGVMK